MQINMVFKLFKSFTDMLDMTLVTFNAKAFIFCLHSHMSSQKCLDSTSSWRNDFNPGYNSNAAIVNIFNG